MHFVPENFLASFAVLAVTFYTLTKSADLLVDGAVGIAGRLRIPKMIIGIVLVGLGTTAPEFVVSMISALKGNANMALGNAVGSVIVDDAVALALGIIVAPSVLKVDSRILKSAGIFLISIDIIAFILALNGVIGHLEGVFLLVILVLYFVILLVNEKKNRDKNLDEELDQELEEHSHEGASLFSQLVNPFIGIILIILMGVLKLSSVLRTVILAAYLLYIFVYIIAVKKGAKVAKKIKPFRKKTVFQFLLLGAGIVMIIFSGDFLVDAAINIAVILKISDVIIGLTVVAIGTSLPEIATCIIASRKGHGDLALGDIIGADILNILWIVGGASAVSGITVQTKVIYFMFPAMLIIVLTMLIFARWGHKLQKWKGFVLLAMYAVYLPLTFILT